MFSKNKLKAIASVLALVLSVSLIQAQNDILIDGIVDNNEIRLKWSPSTYDIMKEGFEYGYTIKRRPIATNGVDLPLNVSISGRRVLQSNMKLPTAGVLSTHTSDAGQLAKAIAYDSAALFNPTDVSSFNLKDVVETRNAIETAHGFFMMAVDQDYDEAMALGFGLIDDTYSVDTVYGYYAQIFTPTDTFSSNEVIIDPTKQVTWNTFENVTGEGADMTAVLKWREFDDRTAYYNIERSADKVTYTKVNDKPFVYLEDSRFNTGEVIMADSLPNNIDSFYYRIQPVGFFGEVGGYSNVVAVKGKAKRYPINLSVNHIEESTINEGEVSMRWTIEKPESDSSFTLASIISHYDVVVQEVLDGPYTHVAGPIAYTNPTQDYTFTTNRQHGYYSLKMVDDNGTAYVTIPHLLQLKDSIPPATPVGLTGMMDAQGNINLDWEANTEEDLKGYLLFFALGRGAEMELVSKEPILTNHYHYVRQQGIHVDSLYFAITAIDKRWNKAELSEVIAVRKPDVTPPSQPLITLASGHKEGIRLGWRLSGDKDVIAYYLTRKLHNDRSWDTIYRFRPDHPFVKLPPRPEELFACFYVDSTYQYKLRTLNYRLAAEDASGNVSYSKIKVVRPYDDGIRGEIHEAMIGGVECFNMNTVTLPSGGGGSSGGGQGGTGISQGGSQQPMPCTLLTWDYITDYPSTLRNFKIYRLDMNMVQQNPVLQQGTGANNTPPYILVKTINAERSRNDAINQGFGSRYVYLDQNATNPGGLPITYKILAEHTDGGFSEWSEVLRVN